MVVYIWRLSGLEGKLVNCLQTWGGILEFVYYADGQAVLERKLIGFGVDDTSRSKFEFAQMNWCSFMHFKSIDTQQLPPGLSQGDTTPSTPFSPFINLFCDFTFRGFPFIIIKCTKF